MLQNEFLEQILPPAPDELLNTIFCNCKNGCGPRCGSRKSGLQCTLACDLCNGQACLNAVSLQNEPEEETLDLKEDIRRTLDLKDIRRRTLVLKEEEVLETMIQDDENDETETFEYPDDDDDEEEQEN